MSEGMMWTKCGMFLLVTLMGVAIMPWEPVFGIIQLFLGSLLFILYLRRILKKLRK